MEKKEPDIPVFRHSNIPLSRGFTLIEIMLVVVIILIASGVVVPKFTGSFKTTQMTDAVRATVRLSSYARTLAILKQQPCTLRFDDHLIVLLCGTNSVETNAFRKLPEDIQISSFENLSEDSRKRDTARIVQFYPVGMNDGYKLTISTDDSHQAVIACNPISGKITVVEEGR